MVRAGLLALTLVIAAPAGDLRPAAPVGRTSSDVRRGGDGDDSLAAVTLSGNPGRDLLDAGPPPPPPQRSIAGRATPALGET